VKRFFWLHFLVLATRPLAAQHGLADSGPYSPDVPTPASVLGYELGEQFTQHHLILRYVERLAEVSPLIRVDTVARTFEGRPVLMAIVTSEANHARLDEIRQAAQRLADPRGAAEAELEQVIRTTPAIVWLGYTVHGGEASGVEAALGFLYQLAAGQDADTRMMLDSTVVLIDPVQNPDGHERHAQDVMRRRGVFGPDPAPFAMVHEGTWPGPRTSHYHFDLNRDWFTQSHPETRGRVAAMLEWYPHVVADLHEMGSNSTYYFAPPMQPVNQNVHETVWKWWDIYAAANADAFDRHGWSFFRRESYDEFYPGYGDSWPIYHGAVGMTYEQASSSGGAIRRTDGTVLTLKEAARHHYTTSVATTLATARGRTERVRDFATFRRTAVTEGERSPLRYIVFERDAQGRADSLAASLIANGVEVQRTSAEAELRQATEYGSSRNAAARAPAGSYVVDLAQPQGRLAKALLEPDAVLDSTFIREELESRRTGEGDRFYDLTGWAFNYLYRVRAWHTRTAPAGLARITEIPASTISAPAESRYGYAFEPGSETSIRMLAALLADSVKVWYAPKWFRAEQRTFTHGAFIVRNEPNGTRVHEAVRRHQAAAGADVVPLTTARVEDGTDLGSNSVFFVRPPRVALAGGVPISGNSYGFAWYALDQRLRYPATSVSLGSLSEAALDQIDVLIIPSASAGGIDGALGEPGRDRLVAWVRRGGVLITTDGATGWLAREQTSLSKFRLRRDSVRADSTSGAPLPANVPGAVARTRGDTLSPLLAGVRTRDVPVLVNSDRIYEAPKDLQAQQVVLRYTAVPELRLTGYFWPEVPERLAETPYLFTERVGSGRVIGFAGDPVFRDMWRGLLPVFANAVLLGRSF
jgi:hypothetical protein